MIFEEDINCFDIWCIRTMLKKKKKENHLDKRFALNSNKLFEIVDNEGKEKKKK